MQTILNHQPNNLQGAPIGWPNQHQSEGIHPTSTLSKSSSPTISIQHAFNILGISSPKVTQEEVADAYRKICVKYHPNRNPAGSEMIKIVNQAYNSLKNCGARIAMLSNREPKDYAEAMNKALNSIIHLGLNISVSGTWIWVADNTQAHTETLQSVGFLWSSKRSAWYFRLEENKCQASYEKSTPDQTSEKYDTEIYETEQPGKEEFSGDEFADLDGLTGDK